jgi:hypothetical protein
VSTQQNGPPIKVEGRPPHREQPTTDTNDDLQCIGSRPQELHCDLGLVDADRTEDMRSGADS